MVEGGEPSRGEEGSLWLVDKRAITSNSTFISSRTSFCLLCQSQLGGSRGGLGKRLLRVFDEEMRKKKEEKKRKKKAGNSEESHTRAYADEHKLNLIYTSARDILLTPNPNRWMKKLNKFNIITQRVTFGWVNRCHNDRLETGILF